MDHPLHKAIGDLINRDIFPGSEVIKDPACQDAGEDKKQHIPLFCLKDTEDKSRKTVYCNVDLLILVKDKIRVIIEIEEANIKPTQVCGKFLTSTLATHYIHSGKKYGMAETVLFIQILNTSKLKSRTSKEKQWENIKKSINEIIDALSSKIKIKRYNLFFGNKDEFGEKSPKSKELKDCIINFLKKEEL